MIIILIILVLTLTAAAFLFTVQRYARALPEEPKNAAFPHRPPASLFAEEDEPESLTEGRAHNQSMAWLEQAARGETQALECAQAAGDPKLYAQTLDALIDAHERQGNLPDLVKRIANGNGLRGSARLAERVIQSWQRAPGRRSTVEMMHMAALSDDAEIYGKAVEHALKAWQDEKLADLKAEDLIALIESQYWEMAAEARSGGAGYALKLKIADARRELTAPTLARG
jgi:hypothetical protein